MQVIVTTQSADLLDYEDFDPDWVRVVAMKDGVTVVGEIDEPGRRVLDEKLATLGALMRSGAREPYGPTRNLQPVETGTAMQEFARLVARAGFGVGG